MVKVPQTGRTRVATRQVSKPLRSMLQQLRKPNQWHTVDGLRILNKPLSYQNALLVINEMGQIGNGLRANLKAKGGYASGLTIDQKSLLVGFITSTGILPFKLAVLGSHPDSKDVGLLKLCQQA